MVAAEQQVHLAANIIRRVREMVANQPKAVASAVAVARRRRRRSPCSPWRAPSRGHGEEGAGRRRPQREGRPDPDPAGDGQPDPQRAATRPPGCRRPRSSISSRRDGGSVVVSVSDNGTGFSQPDGERFSPFASTKRAGLGLGLSISRTIIEAHGGRIWIENRDGRRRPRQFHASRGWAAQGGGRAGPLGRSLSQPNNRAVSFGSAC